MMYVIVRGYENMLGVTIEAYLSREAAVKHYAGECSYLHGIAMHGGLTLRLPIDATDDEIRAAAISGPSTATVVRVTP